jgi:hypothetical protein
MTCTAVRMAQFTCCPVSQQPLQNLPLASGIWGLNTNLVLSEHHLTIMDSSTLLRGCWASVRVGNRFG